MTLQVLTNDAARRSRRLLEEKIASVYVEYKTLQYDLGLFEQGYLGRVGGVILERDELIARITALEALASPDDPQRQREAAGAAKRQRETQEHVNDLRDAPTRPPVTAEIKDLFREAAKRLHPDKGHSEEDRKRRTVFMASVNDAYISGDAEAIRNLMEEFQIGGTIEQDDESLFTVDAMNILLAHLNRRSEELTTLRQSALAQLYAQAQADADGEDGFFRRQHRRLALQIIELKERLLEIERTSHV